MSVWRYTSGSGLRRWTSDPVTISSNVAASKCWSSRGSTHSRLPVVSVLLEVGSQSSPAAGDPEQLAVRLHVPVVAEASLGKGRVEGDAVSVALTVHQGPVDVEYHRLQSAG